MHRSTILSLRSLEGALHAASAEGAPDGGSRTLHVRCGHDIMEKLARAGFSGDFLCFADPYTQGPVPPMDSVEAFVRVRADYLESEHFAANVFADLYASYRDLARAREYESVNIWMEHDSHDQLLLAKLLHFFSDPAMRPPRLRQISVTSHPEVERFVGLGQLSPDALRALWNDFEDVGTGRLALGRDVWDAVTDSTPTWVEALMDSATPALPAMGRALGRHLRELPSVRNGLSLTEQITLEVLAREGALPALHLFRLYTDVEPLPFMGDSGYWSVLRELAGAMQPALRLEGKAGSTNPEVANARVALLPFGERLLRNEVDWLRANAIDRWVGGVHIDSRAQRNWRFDGTSHVVLT